MVQAHGLDVAPGSVVLGPLPQLGEICIYHALPAAANRVPQRHASDRKCYALARVSGPVTDVHVHVQPWEMLKPAVLEAMRRGRGDLAEIERLFRDPGAFVAHQEREGVARTVLITRALAKSNLKFPEITAEA